MIFPFPATSRRCCARRRSLDVQPGSQDFFDLLASFLSALVDYLLNKTLAAARRLPGPFADRLGRRQPQFAAAPAALPRHAPPQGLTLYLPEPRYCTDNAAMIAWLGYEKYLAYPNLNYFDLYLNSYSRASFRASKRHR